MLKIKKFVKFFLLGLLILLAMLFWFSHQVSSSIGKAQQKETLEIVKGDDTRIIAQKLKEKKIIRQESYLIYYLWKEDLISYNFV